jgi:hypothetical protein
VLELVKITDIYWPIECTPTPSFAGVLELAIISRTISH